MKTVAEIVERLHERRKTDFFGFEVTEYLSALPFAEAKEFLKEDATEAEWAKDCHRLKTDDDVLAAMKEYMSFAWNKANNARGLSAGRSMSKYAAWLWLIGRDDISRKMEDYEYYGKPQLRLISELYGIDWKALDDGSWSSTETGPSLTADEVTRI